MIWYPEYVKFIESMHNEPFEWGVNDCGPAWAGRFVEIVTGENLVPASLSRYATARGALRAMRKLGYNDLKEVAVDILGSEPLHPSRGCLGDLALIKDDTPFKYSFGAVNGERVFYRHEGGVGTKDLLEAECVFKL